MQWWKSYGLHLYFRCSLPPVCKKLFKTESARLIEQYNIDVEASMGPKFDYVFCKLFTPN